MAAVGGVTLWLGGRSGSKQGGTGAEELIDGKNVEFGAEGEAL